MTIRLYLAVLSTGALSTSGISCTIAIRAAIRTTILGTIAVTMGMTVVGSRITHWACQNFVCGSIADPVAGAPVEIMERNTFKDDLPCHLLIANGIRRALHGRLCGKEVKDALRRDHRARNHRQDIAEEQQRSHANQQ